MTRRIISTGLLGFVLSAAASVALAAPVAFPETIDLPGAAPGTSFGSLAPDTSYIFSGSIDATCLESSEEIYPGGEFGPDTHLSYCTRFSGDSVDALSFAVPDAGLTSASVSFSNLGFSGYEKYPFTTGTGALRGGSFDPFSLSGPNDILADSAFFGVSEFEVGLFELVLIDTQPITATNVSASFGWTLNVTTNAITAPPPLPPVPLPAGLWLGLTGLGALGVAGRARRRARNG